MKKLFVFLYATSFCFCSLGISNAALWDRGGGLIYDDVLNITWLQDANYAFTSDYDDDGDMSWSQAMTWAENLEYFDSARNVTWDDWRLPKALPVNPPNYDFTFSYDGSTDEGYNITSPNNEMAYMYYVNLGRVGQYDINGNEHPDYSIDQNSGVFENLIPNVYWTQNEYEPNPDRVIMFGFGSGWQRPTNKGSYIYSWPVRTGDVPIPGAILLLCSGLIAFVGFRKKFKK